MAARSAMIVASEIPRAPRFRHPNLKWRYMVVLVHSLVCGSFHDEIYGYGVEADATQHGDHS